MRGFNRQQRSFLERQRDSKDREEVLVGSNTTVGFLAHLVQERGAF
ncbi:hypothetical protein H5T52_10485 [Candidatus Bipolaricaulota bacterium]|nr:hypothetical protein [Candidatus Bipolaricaulota bacterium]